MTIKMLCFCVYTMNILGFFLVMNGMDSLKSWHLSQKRRYGAWSCLIALSFLGKQITKWMGKYWILVFAAEYSMILFYQRKQEKKIYVLAVKGIICITGMILTELLIVVIYHYKWKNLDIGETGVAFDMCSEQQIICGLGIAMLQFFLILLQEVRAVSDRYQKTLMITLGFKSLQDTVWLYICIAMSVFELRYSMIIALFLIGIWVNYIVLLILRWKIATVSEQQKRADIHMNTYEYYLNMEEEHLQIRKMYHEMKNQLMIMGEDSEKKDLEHKYGRTLETHLKSINQFYHTGQPTLDILLFDTRMRAEAKKIAFEAVVSEGCLNFMKEEDISIIFSNALINAIEACEKITDEPRKITIKAGENAEDTLIYIKNTVSRERQKGSLNTNKKNKFVHGIGMGSIQECVEKYHGYISIIEEEGSFQLAILFGKR